jgi:hypothetical protein
VNFFYDELFEKNLILIFIKILNLISTKLWITELSSKNYSVNIRKYSILEPLSGDIYLIRTKMKIECFGRLRQVVSCEPIILNMTCMLLWPTYMVTSHDKQKILIVKMPQMRISVDKLNLIFKSILEINLN